MIEINLLPPEHRPVERTPLPRLMAIFGGVLLVAAAVVAWLWLGFVSVPNAKRHCEERKRERDKVQAVADKVKQIDLELKAATDRQSVLNTLFNERVSWAKLLDRLAEARASVNSRDDVVLTKVEIRRATGPAIPGQRAERRQLYIQAFVATGRAEAGPGELRDIGIDFVRALCRDKLFKEDFECEDAGEKNAKYAYLGDQMTEETRRGAAAPKTGADENRDEIKYMLTFEVAFNFKPPPAPPPPPRPAPKPVAGAKKK